MNVNDQFPSRDLASGDDLQGLLSLFMKKQLLNINDCLPARIDSYDPVSNLAKVTILYQVTMTSGNTFPMVAPAEIPVFVNGSDRYLLYFKLEAGDLGWIKATDRDMTNFYESYNQQPGNTARVHSFEDGFFIPDTMKGLENVKGNVSLQSKDGNQHLTMTDDNITLAQGSNSIEINDSGVIITVGGKSISFTDVMDSQFDMIAPKAKIDGVNMESHIHTTPHGQSQGPRNG